MVWTQPTSSGSESKAVYDALGQRVATQVNGNWRYIVYDIEGKMVAEYGQAATTTDKIRYILLDRQGSTRAILNQSATVLARFDYQPFGEEIASGVGMRTTSQGYGGSDSSRQRYALTERDEATGLDHTWWRKYENTAGRWTSRDPYNGSMRVGDPQSFNRFTYVGNDPINFVDPSGLDPVLCIWRITGYHYFWVYKDGRVEYAFSTVTSFSVTCYRVGGGGGRGVGRDKQQQSQQQNSFIKVAFSNLYEYCVKETRDECLKNAKSWERVRNEVIKWGGAAVLGALLGSLSVAGFTMGGGLIKVAAVVTLLIGLGVFVYGIYRIARAVEQYNTEWSACDKAAKEKCKGDDSKQPVARQG
jgi:RHS repeat-associated protein